MSARLPLVHKLLELGQEPGELLGVRGQHLHALADTGADRPSEGEVGGTRRGSVGGPGGWKARLLDVRVPGARLPEGDPEGLDEGVRGQVLAAAGGHGRTRGGGAGR